MPRIKVTDQDGTTRELTADTGDNLMEVLRGEGYDNIIALCGGCCACATCQVYVDEAWFAKLPAIAEDEEEMLDSSDTRQPNSRLSCQLDLDETMDGLELTIARLAE
ncbi:MAG: 2Fe-2S iron-sulfur cluster binding domain-containing protein [Sphingomonadaceae bacterium]|nr:2Fe-2S iron-sulfur cluster binding domain-containing protein [Sphingomonadaceae bacterium]MCP5390857.1 2Fe-2S iron-sulfur cluster binding domain-containing protein [Sphingomonadaceae bacterium]MCP5394613.1 2Fe-2S iron-sulfur cluster binding domain-containing protein [Sphingomonadaceae bacterium]